MARPSVPPAQARLQRRRFTLARRTRRSESIWNDWGRHAGKSTVSDRTALRVIAAFLIAVSLVIPVGIRGHSQAATQYPVQITFEKAPLQSGTIKLEVRHSDTGKLAANVPVKLHYFRNGYHGINTARTGRKGQVRFERTSQGCELAEVAADKTVVLVTEDDTRVVLQTPNSANCPTCPSGDCKQLPTFEPRRIEGLPVQLVRRTDDKTVTISRQTDPNGVADFGNLAVGEYALSYLLAGREVELSPLQVREPVNRTYRITVGRDPEAAFSPLSLSFDFGFQGSTFNQDSGLSDPNMPGDGESGVFDDTNFFLGIFAEQNHGKRRQNQWFISLQFGGINVEEGSPGPSGQEVVENAESVSFGVAYRYIVKRGKTSFVDSYFGGDVQIYSPTNGSSNDRIDDDFLAEYGAHFGTVNSNPDGLYRGSYVRVGVGQSDRFVDSDRWLVADGQILANFQQARRYKLFARFTFNSDLGRGADDFRVTFGTRIALSEKFATLAGLEGEKSQPAIGMEGQPVGKTMQVSPTTDEND